MLGSEMKLYSSKERKKKKRKRKTRKKEKYEKKDPKNPTLVILSSREIKQG